MAARNRVAALVAVVALLVAGPAAAAPCSTAGAVAWRIAGLADLGKKDYRENISGLACAPAAGGARRCVLVQDEDFRAAVAKLTDGSLEIASTFELPQLGGAKGEFDAEAAAHDGGLFYVLGSHSRRAKRCLDDNPHARQLVRFALDPAKGQPVQVERSRPLAELIAGIPGLAEKFDKCLGTARPDDAKGNWKAGQGVNIEGLAVVGDTVFLGLRGPVLGGAAQIVVTRLEALFGGAKLEGRRVGLTLAPPGGVRDLAAVGGRILILSGSEDDAIGGAAIHLWDGAGGSARKLCDIPDPVGADGKPVDDKPEVLLVLGVGAAGLRVLVLSDGPQGGNPREFILKLD